MVRVVSRGQAATPLMPRLVGPGGWWRFPVAGYWEQPVGGVGRPGLTGCWPWMRTRAGAGRAARPARGAQAGTPLMSNWAWTERVL